MTVLVVEDELLIRMDLEARLKRLDADVIGETAMGEDAVELASRLKPELILMDIQLQGRMDGIEAARQILPVHDCIIVFISAFDQPDFSAMDIPMNANVSYRSKPLSTAQLKEILHG